MTEAAADGRAGGGRGGRSGGDLIGMPRVFLVILEGPFATFFEPFRDPVTAAAVGGNDDMIYDYFGVCIERCFVK